MLYQLSYASPNSLILLLPKDTKASAERGVQIERLSHAEALCNACQGISKRPVFSVFATQSAWGKPPCASARTSLSTSYSTRRISGTKSSSSKYEARGSPSYERLTLPVFTTVNPVILRMYD